MENAFRGNVVKRLSITGSPATVCFRHIVRRRFRWRIGQGEGSKQISPRARTLIVRRTPDFLSPVNGSSGFVKQCADLDDHRRGLWLVYEFFLAPPAHAYRLAGFLYGKDRGVRSSIIGTVVPVTA